MSNLKVVEKTTYKGKFVDIGDVFIEVLDGEDFVKSMSFSKSPDFWICPEDSIDYLDTFDAKMKTDWACVVTYSDGEESFCFVLGENGVPTYFDRIEDAHNVFRVVGVGAPKLSSFPFDVSAS